MELETQGGNVAEIVPEVTAEVTNLYILRSSCEFFDEAPG